MTETDISKVLIEGEYATIMGVKYKRVEEPKPKMNFLFDGKFEVVSYNGENYYRLEFDDESHSWYKRREKLDGNLLKQITDGETHRLLEGLWFNEVKKGKYDDEVAEPKSQTLFANLDPYSNVDREHICSIVAEWLPKEHDTNSYKWNECLKLMREKLR